MFSPIEEIKARLDIVDVIQGYVRLQKAGMNYKAICPFHAEKTPSFFVSPSRQIWHCFGGCGKGGDIFRFIMEIEGHDFPEALKLLAARAGVELKREDPRLSSERNRLYDINEEAAKIFEKNLSLTSAVKAYLNKRGLKEQTIKEFRIGFAPQQWDHLLRALAQKRFRPEEIEKAGLAVKSAERASWYDRFRSRIIFPITDANGRVLGFGGRVFETAASDPAGSSGAKYVNTPQTLIYDKSKVLYGFEKAKQEIRVKNQAVLVEGYMDCVMSHQAGVKNTIAVSGTALTPHQLTILQRVCDTLVSSFDADSAGDSATKRSLVLAGQAGFERKIAHISSGKDPADAVLEDPLSWVKAVEEAKPAVEFYFEKAFRENDPSTAEGKKAIGSILLPWIRELGNEIEKSHWVGEVSRKLGIEEKSVWDELQKFRHDYSENRFFPPREEKQDKFTGRRELLEERLLVLLSLVKETSAEELKKNIVFASSFREELFDVLTGVSAPSPEHEKHIEVLKFKGEVVAQSLRDLNEEFLLCARELEKECIKEKLLKLGEEIKTAEAKSAGTEISALLADFKFLSERLKAISEVPPPPLRLNRQA